MLKKRSKNTEITVTIPGTLTTAQHRLINERIKAALSGKALAAEKGWLGDIWKKIKVTVKATFTISYG